MALAIHRRWDRRQVALKSRKGTWPPFGHYSIYFLQWHFLCSDYFIPHPQHSFATITILLMSSSVFMMSLNLLLAELRRTGAASEPTSWLKITKNKLKPLNSSGFQPLTWFESKYFVNTKLFGGVGGVQLINRICLKAALQSNCE